MPVVELAERETLSEVAARIDAWVARERSVHGTFGLTAAERQEVRDGSASSRWYLRLKGEEKDPITLWLTLHQRTLHHEAHVMPAPTERRDEVLAYLMRANASLYAMTFSLGPEDAVFLTGRVPASLVDDDELDRIVGASIVYVDDHYPMAMTLGHPSLYRRRSRRP